MNLSSLLWKLLDLRVQSDRVWLWWREWNPGRGQDLPWGRRVRRVTLPFCSLASAFLVTDTHDRQTQTNSIASPRSMGSSQTPVALQHLLTGHFRAEIMRWGWGEEPGFSHGRSWICKARLVMSFSVWPLPSPPLTALNPAWEGSAYQPPLLPTTKKPQIKETWLGKGKTQWGVTEMGMKWYKFSNRQKKREERDDWRALFYISPFSPVEEWSHQGKKYIL